MRTKLKDRTLPSYSKKEETFNFVSHIVGAGFGVFVLVMCIVVSSLHHNVAGILTGILYGVSMIVLYTMSSIYHGLKNGTAKKVMQILDHCTIFILIAGTYTPIAICSIAKVNPWVGWGIFVFEWIMAALGITLNAIDLKQFNIISMVIMLLAGWAILPFGSILIKAVGPKAFGMILAGGVVYTIGAVLYAIGSKKPIMHCIFHVFVLVASILQFIPIIMYVL